MASKKPSPKQAAEGMQADAATIADAQASLTAETTEKVEEFVETIKEGSEQMATNPEMPNVAGAASERLQAAFGDMNGRAQTAFERSTKFMEELSDLTKGNVEALVASSKIAARGVETLGQEAADYGRRSFETVSAAMKSFAEAKTPTDLFKLQSDYARSAFDSWVAESSKASETVVKLASEIAEPVTSRYSIAAERVKNVASF